MISQNSLDDKALWHPKYTSFLSEAAFLGFASGDSTKWADGRMVFNDPKINEQLPYFKGISRFYPNGAAVDWITKVLETIDARIPSSTQLISSFDDFSLTVSSEPAVFRIQEVPCTDDVAKCLIAARCLRVVKDEVAFPISISEADAMADLQYASELCIIVGGEKTILTALTWLQDQRTYAYE